MASFSRDDVHDVPNETFQPTHIALPRREFGISAPVRRSFQATWFNRFKWLHYDVGQDSAFCFVCCKAVKERKVRLSSYTEQSFLVKGWKDATRIFARHDSSDFHKAPPSQILVSHPPQVQNPCGRAGFPAVMVVNVTGLVGNGRQEIEH